MRIIMEDITLGLIHPGDETNSFNVSFRSGLLAILEHYPNITLIERPTLHDTSTAIAHAQDLAQLGVDIVIINHLDQRAGFALVKPLIMKRIPIISVEIEFPMTIFLGVDNDLSGRFAAKEAANWIHDNWDNKIDKILIGLDQRVTSTHRQRIESVLNTLEQWVHYESDQILHIDTNMSSDITYQNTYPILQRWKDSHRILMIAIGDTIAKGMLDISRDLGRKDDVVVVSFDGTALALEEFRRPDCRLLVSPTFQPTEYGKHLINLVNRVIQGERVPRQNLIPPLCITRENFEYILITSSH